MKKIITTLAIASLTLTACQTVPKLTGNSNPVITKKLQPKRLASFGITGKIGISGNQNGQSGSAFYGWGQEDERFTIELQGAMGLGFTTIDYNGQTASLTNANVGTITANSPEELLQRATGWQAPISQLPYWISGSPSPSDSSQSVDTNGRLATASNGDWSASFDYKDTSSSLPKKITALHTNGSKVVITISHFE